MPSATSALIVYARKPVTRIGPLEEDFFLIDEFTCEGRVSKNVTLGVEGDEIDVAVGPVSATWSVAGKVLSQRGAADTHPGTKVSPGLLANFDRPRFGISPSDGILIFMGGELTERPGKLADVRFTIDQHFISRNYGSPDSASDDNLAYHGGETNPGSGDGEMLTPYFTNTVATVELTVGEGIDTITLTAGGPTPITFSIASGFALPDGLETLDGVNIIGTPTTVGETLVTFVATNVNGSDTFTLLFRVSAAEVEPPAQITAYIRFLNTPDSGNPYYSAEATFYSYPDYSVVTLAVYLTDVGDLAIETDLPLYDDDGVTEIGTREILEVYAVRPMAGLTASGYLYRKNIREDNIIASLLRAGVNPVTGITGEVPDHVDNPSNPVGSGGSWPPICAPDERLAQYWIIEEIRSGNKYLFSSQSASYSSGSNFESTYPGINIGGIGTQPVKLDPTETDYWKLVEICNRDGTSIYQDSGYSVLEDLLDDGKSPRIYAPAVDGRIAVAAGVLYSGSAGQTIPTLLTPSGYSLPSPIGTVAAWLKPSSLVQTYVLVRDIITGKYVCYGYSDDYVPSISDWYNGFTAGLLTFGGAKGTFAWYRSDVAPRWLIVEIFRKGSSLADESGDGYIYIHSTQSTDRRIERILSHGYTPVQHPLNSGSGVGSNVYLH